MVMRAQEGTTGTWKHKGDGYRATMAASTILQMLGPASGPGSMENKNKEKHCPLRTKAYFTANLFTEHTEPVFMGFFSLPKKFHFENKKSHSIQFWSTRKHKAEKPQVMMRLSLHGVPIHGQSGGYNAIQILHTWHCMDAINIDLPFDLANCILQRQYHRCPLPHQ